MSAMSLQQVPRQDEPLRASELGDALTRLVQGLHFTGISLTRATAAFEKRYIECVLQECGGNKCKAARWLGMHRNTLDRHIAQLKIRVWEFNAPGTRRQQRKELYASKERAANLGGDNSRRSALAPSSAETTQRYSLRKGGRGESLEPSRGGVASTAHLAQSMKPSRGLNFAAFQFEDPDLTCGGLKA